MSIRTHAAFLLLAAALAPPASAEWMAISEADDYIAYADPSTIERSGGLAQMWDVMNLKSPQPSPSGNAYSSSIAHSEFDCVNTRIRTLYFSLRSGQMGEGPDIESFGDPNKWLSVAPGTLLDVLLQFACAER
jgi:hypothetical protein